MDYIKKHDIEALFSRLLVKCYVKKALNPRQFIVELLQKDINLNKASLTLEQPCAKIPEQSDSQNQMTNNEESQIKDAVEQLATESNDTIKARDNDKTIKKVPPTKKQVKKNVLEPNVQLRKRTRAQCKSEIKILTVTNRDF